MQVKKYLSSVMLLALGFVLSLQAGGRAMASITTPLTVYSSNRHYFVNNGQQVVFIGTGQILPGIKSGGYRSYIDNLAAHNVNYARVWHLLVWDATNAYFPWARDGGGTANDGLPKYNLTHWDSTFWSNIKDMCAYAQSKNIYVSIMLFDECGIEAPETSTDHRWNWHPFNPQNNVNGLSLPTSPDAVPEFYSLTNGALKSLQEQYVSKLIAETSGYPNVIYEICNEYTGPWNWEKYWIDYVTARCSNMISVNRLGTFPSNYWTDSNIDMVKFHWGTLYASASNQNMNSNYSQGRAINYDETPELTSITYKNYRNMLWGSFTGGGHIHLENGENAGAACDAVMYANNFLQSNGVHFWEMTPNNSLVTSSPGGSAYTLAKPGSEYIVYINGTRASSSMGISLTSGLTYSAKAYNPSNGTYTTLSVSGNTVSGIPSYSEDIVVYIKATGAVSSNPSVTLSMSASKTSVVPGDTVTYTVAYKNSGSGTANSVAITCPVPQYMTYVSGGTYNSTNNTVNWSIASVAAGATGSVTFQVKVN